MLSNVPTYLGHVNGNRFLLIDMREQRQEECAAHYGRISVKVCQSPFVDDFIVLEDSTQATVRIRIFGGDGKEADFCGNGVLFTLGLLAQERRPYHYKVPITVATGSGIKRATVDATHGSEVDISPVRTVKIALLSLQREEGVKIFGLRIAGEPHLLVSPEKNSLLPAAFCPRQFERFAGRLAARVRYPGGVNVTAIFSMQQGEIEVKTFERGVQRMTASCGSAAVAVASYFLEAEPGLRQVVVKSPGGFHEVHGSAAEGDWWLKGKATIFGKGQLGDFLNCWTVE